MFLIWYLIFGIYFLDIWYFVIWNLLPCYLVFAFWNLIGHEIDHTRIFTGVYFPLPFY